MKSFKHRKDLSIKQVLEEAKRMTTKRECVELEYNGIEMIIFHNSDLSRVEEKYHEKIKR